MPPTDILHKTKFLSIPRCGCVFHRGVDESLHVGKAAGLGRAENDGDERMADARVKSHGEIAAGEACVAGFRGEQTRNGVSKRISIFGDMCGGK